MLRPHLGPCALALTLLMWAGACTSEGEPPTGDSDAAERLEAAAEATRAAGTARIEQKVSMTFDGGSSGEPSGGGIEVDASGFLDMPGRRARLSVTTTGSGLAGADALGGNTEMILDGRALYMKSPFYQQLAPHHEPWLRVTLAELAERGMSQLGQQDPLIFVELLRGVEGPVEEIGEEVVRGDAAVHYRATIDVRTVTSELTPAAARAMEATFSQLGVRTMPVDVWLDGEDRLRRLSSRVELQRRGVGGGVMVVMVELYEFGVAFDLTIPPAGEVAEFAEVFGAANG